MRFKFKLCCGYYIHKKKLELGQSTRIGHEVIGSNFVVPEKENKKVRTRPKKEKEVFFVWESIIMYMCAYIPSEEFWNGFGAKDWRSIAIGDAVDVGLDVLVGYDRQEFLEGFAVGLAVEVVSLEVLNVCIVGEDFGEDPLLNLVCVGSDILNELEGFLVLLQKVVVSRCLRHGCGDVSDG